jgi:ABC-type Na+ efflux pump permease subunit
VTTSRWHEIRLVARQDFLDFVRNRAAVKRLVRLPLIVIGTTILIGAVSFVSAGGSLGDVSAGVDQLTARRRVTAVPLSTQPVERTVAVKGVGTSHPLVAALKERRDARVISAAIDKHVLATTRQRITAAGLSEDLVTSAEVAISVRRSSSPQPANRGPIGSVAVFMLFPLLSMIGTASERISGARDRRVIEPLLVLPLRRTSVLVGKGLSALGIAFLSIAAPFGPLMLLAAIPAVMSGLTGFWWRVTAAIAIGLAASCVLTVAYGLFTGARARSTGETGLINRTIFLVVPLIIVSANVLGNLSWAIPTLLAVPLIGTVLFIQHTIVQGPNVIHALLLVLSCLATAALLLALGARALGRDAVIIRATT